MMTALVAPIMLFGQVVPISAELDQITTPEIQWLAILPLLILSAGGILLLTAHAVIPGVNKLRCFDAAFTVVVGLATIGAAIPVWLRVQDEARGPLSAVAGALGIDGFSVGATVLIAISLILTALVLHGYLKREDLAAPEFYALILLSAAGGAILASANDLVTMFVGFETLSISIYVLAAMHRRRAESQEAGFKYFIVGGFSSGFFLYGIAMVYGATGSTNLADIGAYLAANILLKDGLLLFGMALLLVGFAFKVSSVPFQMWTPDVYQGSPTPITGFMASAVKVAAFAGIVRVFYLAFSSYSTTWQPVIYALAILSMVIGATLAIVQTDVKRMLAYSSINHAGFVLVGIQAATPKGMSATLFYLGSYVFMVIGSFGIVAIVSKKGDAATTLDDYRGLSKSRAGLAFAFTVFLLAQAGVPFTSGFFGKFYVIGAAVDANSYWLALAAMVTSVISAALYLKIIVAMYLTPDDEQAVEGPTVVIPRSIGAAVGIAVVATLVIGILPGWFIDLANDAVPVLTALP